MREYGMPALAAIPASASLTDVVFRRGQAEPGAVMLRRRTTRDGWQDVTAGQFRTEVAALARGIIAAGIDPGDRVGLMSRTRYEWTLIDYAIWAAGGVTVPVYETSSAEQVEWILGDSAARAIFAETSTPRADHQQRPGIGFPGIEHLWMIDGLDTLASGGVHISAAQLDRRRAGTKATDLATIVYTSGTTGRPKGCELTHGNLLADVRNAVARSRRSSRHRGARRRCCSSRLRIRSHGSSRLAVLEAGVILGHLPEISTLADGLSEFRPTFLLAVPRVFEKAYDSAQRQASVSKATARIFAAAAGAAIAGARPAATLELAAALVLPSGSGMRCSTGSCTGGSGRRSAATSSTRSAAARRSASGSATSSAARVSRCWRATA